MTDRQQETLDKLLRYNGHIERIDFTLKGKVQSSFVIRSTDARGEGMTNRAIVAGLLRAGAIEWHEPSRSYYPVKRID